MYHHLDSTIKPLIGRTIVAVERFADDAARVYFSDGSNVTISVEGDCCSHSIFYAIDVPEGIEGAILQDIQEKSWDGESLGSLSADTEEVALQKVKGSGIEFFPEENSIWNVVIVTTRGNILLRHINSSNGYYDGSTRYEITD